MDRLSDNFVIRQPAVWEQPLRWNVALDVTEDENEFVVKASLPGINPEDIDVTFDDDRLTIKGEIKSDEEKEGTHYRLRERRYGSFSRSISLPRGIKAEDIQASYDAGILTLHLPKIEEIKPKRIEVQTSDSSSMIEGEIQDIAKNNN
jgi:HSP20 family protein